LVFTSLPQGEWERGGKIGEREMIIKKTKIRNPAKYLNFLSKDERFFIGVTNLKRFENKLKAIGFTNKIQHGETILPPSLGPTSDFNTNGKFIIHKDQEKEYRYVRTVWWEWEQWAGHGKTEHHSDWKNVHELCYPRTFIEPPGVQFTAVSLSNDIGIVSPSLQWSDKNKESITHIINLFLEIFKEATVYNKDLEIITLTELITLNWEILPKGEMPWEQLQKHIKPIFDKAKKGNHRFIEERIKTIEKYNPDFCAIGKGGFQGYIIFGLKHKNINVVESGFYGNATYLFGKDWKKLSQFTKKQIISNDLCKNRIIHDMNWFDNIRNLLKK
jgi:hypothetical protein